jgi:hypothetical protein
VKHDYEFTAEAVTTLSVRRLSGRVHAENVVDATALAGMQFLSEFRVQPSGVTVTLERIDVVTWGG